MTNEISSKINIYDLNEVSKHLHRLPKYRFKLERTGNDPYDAGAIRVILNEGYLSEQEEPKIDPYDLNSIARWREWRKFHGKR